MNLFVWLLMLTCLAVVSTSKLDDVITPCGVCTCNMRQASADCSERQLKHIPARLPANITNLNLATNQIRWPSEEGQGPLCQQYPHLKTVSLAWNGIRSLSSLLQGCHFVEELDLAGNILEIVPATVFADLHNLHILSSLEVQQIEVSTLQHLKQLETLHLAFHGLTVPPAVFGQLPSLKSLTLVLEKALRLPQRLFGFFKGNVLKQLSLTGLKVKQIPDDLFTELVSLKELHLDLPHVLQLKITTNDKHKYLQVLEVSNVRSVAEDLLSGLHFLQVVILQGISHLIGPRLFHTATAVKELEIVQCSLAQLPQGWLDNMLALETLNLSDNRLEKLSPHDFLQLTSLKHLVLSNNKIQDVAPSVFSPLKSSLQQLLLNDNQLRQLAPGTFSDMHMLEVLDLRRNMINNITANSLSNLPRLHMLQLSGNYISSLNHVLFDSLPSLEELDLSDNIISELPETLLASKLSRLLLSANNLNHLPGQGLCDMTNLQQLALDDNPVVCDCPVRGLHQCLPQLLLSGTCAQPADVAGTNMEQVAACAASISVWPVSTLLSHTASQVLFHVAAFSLEPTPLAAPGSDTWSPLLLHTTFTSYSVTSLASSVADMSLSVSLRSPLVSSIADSLNMPPNGSVMSSPTSLTLISPSSHTELTVSPSHPPDLVVHSQTNLLLTSDSILQAWLTSKKNIQLEASLGPSSTAQPSFMTSTHSSPAQPSLAATSLTHTHEPIEDMHVDYDSYHGQEIVRPLVAGGILERNVQRAVMSDTDQVVTQRTVMSVTDHVVSTQLAVMSDTDQVVTQLAVMSDTDQVVTQRTVMSDTDQVVTQSSVAHRLNSSVVNTHAHAGNMVDVHRPVINDSPLQQHNGTDLLPPRVAHVKAEPDAEQINGVLSVAGEITVAMFFSLVILLSILSGILVYRKYVHVGSYNAAQALQAQHFIDMQPVLVDEGNGPTASHATTISAHPTQVPG